MAITYTKLDSSKPIKPDEADGAVGNEWKWVEVEKSVERNPFKSTHTYMSIEKQLLSLKAQVSDLEAVLVEIEKVAKP